MQSPQEKSDVAKKALMLCLRDFHAYLSCPATCILVASFLSSSSSFSSASSPVGTAGLRAQWALPGPNREPHIPVCTAFNREPHIPVCTAVVRSAGPQLRAPDPMGTASSRSQWALPDINRECQSPVGTAGPQPRAPYPSAHCPQLRAPHPSGHCRTSRPDRMSTMLLFLRSADRLKWPLDGLSRRGGTWEESR
eukprot:s1011_g7.t1